MGISKYSSRMKVRLHKTYQKMGPKRFQLIGVVIVILFSLFMWKIYDYEAPVFQPTPVVSSKNSLKVEKEKDSLITLNGSIGVSGSVYEALISQGVAPKTVLELRNALKPVLDFKSCKRDDMYLLRLNKNGDLVDFTYQKSLIDVYVVENEGGKFCGYKKEVPLDKFVERVSGVLMTSLFEDFNRIGESDQLALNFVDIFSWKIDFNMDPREGDTFDLLVEKYFKNGTFIKYGNILAARYNGEECQGDTIYFKFPDGKGGYYSPEGKSMKSAFLKSPLRFTRISSRYSLSRRHPILGGLHPHLGIDYAAKTGTPVWSVADGVVQFVGWKGGYGRQVVIKHKGGYKTYYAHFSRFARGIRKGVRVKQKQIVGYVGATGLATGPHLDFRVSKNGTFMNPLSVKYPGGDPIPKKYEKDFEKEKTRLISLFEDTSFERMKIN